MAGWGPEVPRQFAKRLIPSEHLVLAVRRHPAMLIEPVGSTVAALVAVLWLQAQLPRDLDVVPDVLWLLWLPLPLRALWKLYEWSQDWFVVTDQRLMLNYGVLVRRVAMMPMPKVTDMSYNRTPVGRVFGYGEFVLESAGQDQALKKVSWLPNPDHLYQLICVELFGTDNRYETPEPAAPPPPRKPPAWRGFRLGPGGGGPEERAADEASDGGGGQPGGGPRYDTDVITTITHDADAPVYGTAWDEDAVDPQWPDPTGWAEPGGSAGGPDARERGFGETGFDETGFDETGPPATGPGAPARTGARRWTGAGPSGGDASMRSRLRQSLFRRWRSDRSDD